MKKNIRPIHLGGWIILGVLSCILIVSGIALVRDITQVRRVGNIHPQSPFGMIVGGSGSIKRETSKEDIENIETWMTFGYINFAFHLPENLLKDKLNINTPQYPRIPLRKYIQSQGLNPDIFLIQVKDIVRQSFVPNIHK